MSSRPSRIALTKKQIDFIIRVTGVKDPMEAVEYLATIMVEERVDPTEMEKYVKKMMEKQGG